MLLFLLNLSLSLSLSSASVSRSIRLRTESRIGFVNLFFFKYFFLLHFVILWASFASSNFNEVAFIKSAIRTDILSLLKQLKRIFFCLEEGKKNQWNWNVFAGLTIYHFAWKVSPNTNFDNCIVNDDRQMKMSTRTCLCRVYSTQDRIVVLIKF